VSGVVLGWIGFAGLALVVGIAVIATVVLAPLGRIRGDEPGPGAST